MLGAVLFPLLMAAQPADAGPKFEVTACPTGAQPLPRAKCGVVRVPEDHTKPDGRTFALNLIVISSAGERRLPPLFDIDGGPGLPATKNAEFYGYSGVSKNRDVVLVDQRGTGRSNALECPDLAKVKPTEPMLPPALVQHCHDMLSSKADVRFYGTVDAIYDLEAVRQALGYDKIDLFGLSYGTTVALSYMRRHPDKVRAAVLMGTAPPDAMPPRQHAPAATRALHLFLADCKRDSQCNERFPTLAEELAKARRQIAAKRGSEAGELFMERVRARMYSPESRAALPLAIEKAANGDMSAIFPASASSPGPTIADGMFMAVTCTESFGLMDYDVAAAEARSTPFGDYRLRRQRDACAHWPKGRTARDHLNLPTSAGIAVLVISGEMDPVTPPEWGDSVAAALPRSKHIVIPRSGHIVDGMSGLETCLDPLLTGFLDRGDPEKLDTSCIAEMKPPAYVLK